MSTSSAAVAGTNATAQQYNDLRSDAITRYIRIYIEVAGPLAIEDSVAVVTIPATMTLTKIKHKVVSGSATLRVKTVAGAAIKSGIAVSTSYANETSGFSTSGFVENDEIQLDLTGVSSADTLRVELFLTETI